MKKRYERGEEVDVGMESISISSIDPSDQGEGRDVNPHLELQLKMATSSINHEYARMEYDETDCHERRDELLEYMQNCRCEYFEARETLSNYDPYALAEFEKDLLIQKQQALRHYTA